MDDITSAYARERSCGIYAQAASMNDSPQANQSNLSQENLLAANPGGLVWDCCFLEGPRVSSDFLEDRGSQAQAERKDL